jgi:hypothetical protein
MSDFEPTNPVDTLSGHPALSTTPEPSAAASSGGAGAGATPPPPPTSLPEGSASTPRQARRPRLRRLLADKKRRWIVVTAAATCAVIGVSVGVATSRSTTPANPVAATSIASGIGTGGGTSNAGSGPAAGGASNARSGPAAGGAAGTVTSVSPSGFMITTSAGQKVTVIEASSTTYQNGTSSASASDITTGENVLALGTTNGTTITATQITVTPAGGAGSPASGAAAVVPFQSGAPTVSKQVGQVPANFNPGSGTIVSGATANKATEAALAAYPGGVVDRVVQLSNGQYNVHYIGVNWPHHVFVDQNFNVVGAL